MQRLQYVTLFLLLFLLQATVPARAHDLSLSGIRILLRSHDVVINVSTPISRLIRAEGNGKKVLSPIELDLAVRRRLHLRLDGAPIVATQATVKGDELADQLVWQTTISGTPNRWEVLARLYPEDSNSRTVVTIIRNKQLVQEVLLDALHPAMLPSEPRPSNLSVGLRYLHEGIGHIFGGPDHILFVLGLLLLGGKLGILLRTVTAFTLAHSITLSLAATGAYTPPSRIVEPLIALSIVAIAVENLRQFGNQQKNCIKIDSDHPKSEPNKQYARLLTRHDLRPYFAFGFGLIHGFGFASALAEVGLPKEALGVALLAFNGGVEVGQVTIILMVAPLLAWLAQRHPRTYRAVVLTGSIGIGIMGAYWFFSRL